MAAPLSYKNDNQADERLNPAERLKRAEEQSRFNDIANNYDQAADDSQENTNIQNARNREQAGSGFKVDMAGIQDKGHRLANTLSGPGTPGLNKFTTQLRKNGPIGAIIAAVMTLFGFGAFAPLGMPLLVFKQNVTEARGAASRAQPVRYQSVMRYMVGNKGVETACAKNVAGPRCKLGTMSKPAFEKYKQAGFKVEGKAVGGRWIVHTITAPDGNTVMRDGDSFIRKMTTDLKFSRISLRAHNAANNVFNGGIFNKLLIKLGLNKAPLPDLPTNKDERTKAANKIFKLNDDGTADREKVRSNIQERASKSFADTDPERLRNSPEGEITRGGTKIKLAKGLAAIPGVACMVYNTARLIVNTAKIERLVYYASFALPFLKVPDDMKDEDNKISDTTVAQYANQVTTPSTAKGMEGLTAMDAQGVKLILGGNEQGMAEYTKNALLFNSDILKGADYLINTIDSNIQKVQGLEGGVKGMCRLVSSWQGQVIGVAACVLMTAISGSAGTVGGTVVPGAGNIVGGLGGLAGGAAGCLISVVGSVFIEKGVEWAMKEWLLPWAAQAAIAGLPNASSVGPPVGEALAIGSAVILNKTNRANGLIPVGKSKLRAFNDATRESDNIARQAEIAEARDTPFDIYNQYSFLGSIMSGMHKTVYTPESRMNSGNFSLQRLFSAFSLAPSALAVGESPSVITAADLSPDNCSQELKELGAECDISGQLAYGMSVKALHLDVLPTINWMETNGQIDDTGAPVHDGKFLSIKGVDYTYEKFVSFCAERENEIGITTEPIESDIYDWSLGKHCFDDNEAMDYYEAYYSLMSGNQDADYTEAEGDSGVGLDVMSYNILGTHAGVINDNDGGIPWRDRINSAVSAVKSASPDVIGFQEVTGAGTKSQFDLLKEGLSDTYTSFPEKETNYSTRPIFWKSDTFALVDSGTYSYPRKGVTGVFPWVKLRDNDSGKEFYVFNTHTSSDSDKAKERRDQTKKLIAAIKKEAPPGTPVIATGDFNATCEKTGNDKGVSLAEIPCTIMRDAGFEDAGEVAHQMGRTTNFNYATSHGEPNSLNKSSSGKGRHIDHVFYSGGISVQRWENVINEDTTRASDHTPVVATLQMAADPDNDTASGDCPAGTTLVNGINDGWERSGTKKKITLCTIPGTRAIDNSATPHWRDPRYKGTSAAGIKQIAVNADSAAQLLKLAKDAKKDGITLTATIGYRSLYEQCSIVINRYKRPSVCPSWITPAPRGWKSNATYSNHMMGYSIDFSGSSISWMKRNGPRCGWIDDVYRSQGWDAAHFTNKGSTPGACGIGGFDNLKAV